VIWSEYIRDKKTQYISMLEMRANRSRHPQPWAISAHTGQPINRLYWLPSSSAAGWAIIGAKKLY